MKLLDYLLPIFGGAGGSIFGVITFGSMLQTAISAAIFALVGGAIGFFTNRILKKYFGKND